MSPVELRPDPRASVSYCPPGNLRDQLFYPSTEQNDDCFSTEGGAISYKPDSYRPDGGAGPADESRLQRAWTDDDLLEVLQKVDLPHLANRSGGGDPRRGLDAVLDWSHTLSLGEQQRLAFGRLVVNRPALVVMDESTSALDVVAERRMYALLREMSEGDGRGVTYVSVGHRPTLLAHHNLKLSLRDGKGYISNIPPTTSAVDESFY